MTNITIVLVVDDVVPDELGSTLRAASARVFTISWSSLPALLEQHRIDACVLGETDAVQRCRALRKQGFRLAVVVRAMHASQASEIDALDAGADDYWRGSDGTSLLARIRATLRRCGEAPLPLGRVGRITFDGEDVTVDGQRCLLTRRELSLLHLLSQHAGEVVTRRQILTHWGLVATPQEGNFIDVHVMRLRRKLGAAGGQLETVRGQGLCLHDTSARHGGPEARGPFELVPTLPA